MQSMGAAKPGLKPFRIALSIILSFVFLALTGLLGQAYSPVKTIVSLTFDDGYADQFNAEPILYVHGMRGTFYMITARVGQPGYMTWDQLRQLQVEGSEIGGHTITHPDLKKLSSDEVRHEICDGRVDLIDHGFKVTSFAYPFGDFDQATMRVVAECGYNSGRSVNGRQETIPPQDAYNLRAMDTVQSDTTLTMLRGYVKQTERAGGGWVNLTFHHVCNGCDKYAITPKDFSALLDWLRTRESNGTVVRTVDEVMGGQVHPPVTALK